MEEDYDGGETFCDVHRERVGSGNMSSFEFITSLNRY